MRRHPLLWKLALLQIAFCLLLTWIIWIWGVSAERRTYFLSAADQQYLADYARQAEGIWHSQGTPGLARFTEQLAASEGTWVTVLGPTLQSLSNTPLNAENYRQLTFMRQLNWPMSRRLQD